MKTVNALFTSVILKNHSVITALHFELEEAKKIMIGMLTHNFDIEQDEGFIFENRRVGEGEAVFNYRAYLNQESEPKRKAAKENKHVKIFFHCPHCGAEEGKLNKDEDEEIVMICGSCKESVPVF